MKHLFIVNPVAGGKDCTDAVAAKVARAFSGQNADFEIYTTKAPMDAADKVIREAERCDELRVYACGGDGTLNECVCGAAGRENVAVTHFPMGTGNDFIKVFGPERERFRDLEELLNGQVRKLDVIDCNGRSSLNICSVGIDARVGTDVHKYSKMPLMGGIGSYIASLVVNFCKSTKDELRVICDGKLYYGDMSLVCACNGSYYGGGFHPVPEARPDDGKMEVLVVKGVSRLKILQVVGAYAKGRYAEYPDIITPISCTELRIESEKELVVNLDGEAVYGRTLQLQLRPGAVNFIVPANMAYFAENKEEALV